MDGADGVVLTFHTQSNQVSISASRAEAKQVIETWIDARKKKAQGVQDGIVYLTGTVWGGVGEYPNYAVAAESIIAITTEERTIGPTAADRMATALETAVRSEREGDEWRDHGPD